MDCHSNNLMRRMMAEQRVGHQRLMLYTECLLIHGQPPHPYHKHTDWTKVGPSIHRQRDWNTAVTTWFMERHDTGTPPKDKTARNFIRRFTAWWALQESLSLGVDHADEEHTPT